MERFVLGFIFGAMPGLVGALYGVHFIDALIFGFISGILVGSSSALFGKRVFDFLIALITRFAG